MARLKLDRSVNVKLNSGESVYVPSDEVWKGTLFAHTFIYVNNQDYDDGIHECLFGGGCIYKDI